MKPKIIRKCVSFILALVMLFSMSCMVFAAEKTTTNSRNGNVLEGYLYYFASEGVYQDGEVYLGVSWTGSNVQKMYATVEVVDYLTGATLLTSSNNSSNTTNVATSKFVGVPTSTKVTVFGCGEIRDSFSLLVSPTISGTYGKADGTR